MTDTGDKGKSVTNGEKTLIKGTAVAASWLPLFLINPVVGAIAWAAGTVLAAKGLADIRAENKKS
jgi:hypothetical protein